MSDWENDDFEIVALPTAVKDSWDDEEETDVKPPAKKASWEEEEKEQEKPSNAQVSAPKPKKKLAQKIAEREEELKKREASEAKKKLEESPEERKRREQEQVLASDIENAKDLFGGLDVKEKTQVTSIDEFQPKTKTDFEQFGKLLSEKISNYESSAFYLSFVETLVRDLCAPLSLDDSRKISTILSAQINEKQKAFSNKKKKGATTKKAQLKGSVEPDVSRYEPEDLYAGEYDDFM